MQLDRATRSMSLSPRDAAFVQQPYAAYARLHQAGAVFFWEDYGKWCFAGHGDVSALLRDRRFGRQILHVKSRAELGWPAPAAHLAPFDAIERHSLLELEPPDHTRLRGLVNRAFVSRRIEQLRARISSLAHELIDRFAANGQVELIAEFATPLPVVIIAELIGVPADDAPMLLDWSHKMVAMYQFGRDRAVENSAAAASAAFAAYLRQLIAKRRNAPRDDLLSGLIAAEEAGQRLSEDEMVSTLILLLNAGHEATEHTIGNGVKAVLEVENFPERAFTSPEATPSAVEELLRFDAPLHMFTRYALQDVEYRGVQLRTGDRVGLMLGAANHDPAVFAQPGRFDPARANAGQHVSFGGGIHFCIGAPLARLELQLALPILFQRLPALRFSSAPRYRDSYHFRGLERLPLQF